MEGVLGRGVRGRAAAGRGANDMVQVRHTGRMLRNFRIGLGGEARLKVDVDLGAMVPRDYQLSTNIWP